MPQLKGCQRYPHLSTAVVEAVKAGYRGFDTAQLYGTHKAVGAGLHKCFKVG